jgi:1,4-dihydroxy-2-naphthoyl-CoA hydrolase
MNMPPVFDLDHYNTLGTGYFPGLIGFTVTKMERGAVNAQMQVRQELMAPNGYLHAGSIVTLADTACGYGCRTALPEGATGFTTIELKSNFLGTAREGVVEVEATLLHGGRMTQVWDALVRHRDSGKMMATFRCTQMILYPK